MINSLTWDEALALLRRAHVARLGCVTEGEPYVVPINYFIRGDCAYLHSLPGRKVKALRDSPRACLQVDEIRDELHWQSVLAFGSCEEVLDPEERGGVLNAFYARQPDNPIESNIAQDASPPQIVVFRIRIDRVTGVCAGPTHDVEVHGELSPGHLT